MARRSLAWVAGTSLAAATSAQAQIEEVVVTATKRETQLQETPIAITAFGADAIERNQIEDFRDVALRTPGLVFAQTNSMSLITLRGVGLDITNLAGETAVAVYRDGVYQGQTFSLTMPAFDLERIEVLRGPQGTLYGRNATGGAVNIISRQPSFEPEFDVAATVGDYDRHKLELSATGAIGERLALRGSFVLDHRLDGYRDNVTLDKEEDRDKVRSGRLSALLTPAGGWEIALGAALHDQHRSGTELSTLQFAPTALGYTPVNLGGFLTFPDPNLGGLSLADLFGLEFPEPSRSIVDPDDLIYVGDFGTSQDFETSEFSATVTWEHDALTFKSITAYRESEWDRASDNDGTDIHILHQLGYQKGEQLTQEFNLSGTNGPFDWIVGAYYFDEDAEAEFLYSMDAMQTTFEAIFGLFSPLGAPLPPGSLAAAGAAPFGRHLGRRIGEPTPPTPFLDFQMFQDSQSYAVFGEGTWNATDRLALTAGIRWTSDEKKVTRNLTSNIADPSNLCIDQRDDEDWSEITGQFIASYRITDDINAYGKLARGYKAGGFNPGECQGAFDPETLWAYEIGTKAELFDRQLRLNSALFLYDYDDIQVNRFVENASSIQNAAEAEVLGVEVEFIAIPGFLPGLMLSGSVSWLDTEYKKGAFSDPIAGGPPIDISGNDLMRAPEWKVTLAAEYSWQTTFGEVSLIADWSYTDNYYFDVFEASLPNQDTTEQESYSISNLRVVWTSRDERWELQGFIENLEDELYTETRVPVGTTGSVLGEWSAPRTWGIRLAARLGG